MDAERLNKKITSASFWVFRGVALLSLTAHLFLVFFSNIRRRKACDWRRSGVWLAYQVNNWATPYLLGNLYLENTPSDKQLFAFWVPFLLLHLARPDNISGYTMEDNELSGRVLVFVPLQSIGAILVVLRYIQIDSTAGTLRPAAWIMLFLGIFKYAESYMALRRGKLSSIRSSIKFNQQSASSGSARHDSDADSEDGEQLKDEKALLAAHDLFDVCKGAFSDCSVGISVTQRQRAKQMGWKKLCKVVEMELSLMYDLMYTKAAVVHTCGGYIIRVLSPLLTAAALILFLYRYRDQVFHNRDVDITCILMGTTLVLDVRWLVKAMGSTWTYGFLKGTKWEELQHAVLCSGGWQRLRRWVVTLDPTRLSWSCGLKEPSSSYRMWARTIGQHNLLREFRDSKRFFSRLATSIGLEESWNEFYYSWVRGLDFSLDEAVRNYLFKTVWLLIVPQIKEEMEMMQKHDLWVDEQQADHRTRRKLDKALGFDPELEEIILIWHIATEVFLSSNEDIAAWPGTEKPLSTETAIKALSDYMLFLVAVRPGMLPGLKLRSLYEGTRSALNKLWDVEKKHHGGNTTGVEKKLAGILRDMEGENKLHNSSLVLSDGAGCAWRMLTRLENTKLSLPPDRDMPSFTIKSKLDSLCPELFYGGPAGMKLDMMLDLIFDVWVHLLIYASIRCSRDSHAKQLSQGGDLTTIVWMLTQHTGLFSERQE